MTQAEKDIIPIAARAWKQYAQSRIELPSSDRPAISNALLLVAHELRGYCLGHLLHFKVVQGMRANIADSFLNYAQVHGLRSTVEFACNFVEELIDKHSARLGEYGIILHTCRQ